MTIRTTKALMQRARQMRRNPTNAERILWSQLRKNQLLGLKFRRQHVFAPYILDFYCCPERLAIEVDGSFHNQESQRIYDERRTAFLKREYHVDIIRVGNDRTLNELDEILDEIRSWILKKRA